VFYTARLDIVVDDRRTTGLVIGLDVVDVWDEQQI